MSPEINTEPNMESISSFRSSQKKNSNKYNLEIVWKNVIIMSFMHMGAVYGLYLILSGQCKFITIIWLYITIICSGLGVTAGSHRLWAHRSYKATWQLRLLLMLFQTMAFQNHIYEWVRDHRVHHKFTDTDADPHNSKRGFFFSHAGWLLVKKHVDVKEKGKTVGMSDMEDDSIIMFQKKNYFFLMPLLAFVFPALLPWYLFNEVFWNAWWVCCLLRYVYTLNVTWLVNSAAHAFGYRPYDQNISAAENISVGFLALGEGWHNYHHVFPWDYKTAELPTYNFNFTLGFIDLMAKIGWAYDLKTVSSNVISRRASRTGIHLPASGNHREEKNIWGWDDTEITKADIACCQILHRKEETKNFL